MKDQHGAQIDFRDMSPEQRKKRIDELWAILRHHVNKQKVLKLAIADLDAEPHIELIDEREQSEDLLMGRK